jgi:predicted NBD/HSP70 family sugar kinase
MDQSPTERGLRERIDAFGPEVRALLLNVFNLADEDRVPHIGELWADERTRLFAELPIDVEEDITVRAFVIAELKRARALVSGVLSS